MTVICEYSENSRHFQYRNSNPPKVAEILCRYSQPLAAFPASPFAKQTDEPKMNNTFTLFISAASWRGFARRAGFSFARRAGFSFARLRYLQYLSKFARSRESALECALRALFF